MKLQTSITPRRAGNVTVLGKDGKTYEFKPGEDGTPECDIQDEATLAHLLAGENFWPADPDDYAQANQLLDTPNTDPDDGPDTGDEPLATDLAGKTDEELDLEDDEGDPNALPVEGPAAALPIEAETPPQVAPDRAAKANTAAQRANKRK